MAADFPLNLAHHSALASRRPRARNSGRRSNRRRRAVTSGIELAKSLTDPSSLIFRTGYVVLRAIASTSILLAFTFSASAESAAQQAPQAPAAAPQKQLRSPDLIFDMGSWKPEQALKVDQRSAYFWTIPAPGTPAYEAAMAAANGKQRRAGVAGLPRSRSSFSSALVSERPHERSR